MAAPTPEQMVLIAEANAQAAAENRALEEARMEHETQKTEADRLHVLSVLEKNNRVNAINNAKDIIINMDRSKPVDQQILSEETVLALAANLIAFVNAT